MRKEFVRNTNLLTSAVRRGNYCENCKQQRSWTQVHCIRLLTGGVWSNSCQHQLFWWFY